MAHSICELAARKKFTVMKRTEYDDAIKALMQDPLYKVEMLTTAAAYVQYLTEKVMSFDAMPHVTQEVKVDFSEYVPQGFGTSDCVIIGGDTLIVVDYKHGKGVRVSAIGNSQMRLYALGALKHYAPLFGNQIKKVITAIVQPRISEEVSEEVLTVETLNAWGESIKPVAQEAYYGPGNFVPGDWCRFCRGKAQCRARADKNTALEEFKDIGFSIPDAPPLTEAEIADLIHRGADLVAWYNDLKDYAVQTILAGGNIPGYKVVAGKSNRAFSDTDKALSILEEAGYPAGIIYERKPKTLAQLEKLVGKKDFAELVGGMIIRPAGKPTLTEENDPREAYSPAAVDFEGVDDG